MLELDRFLIKTNQEEEIYIIIKYREEVLLRLEKDSSYKIMDVYKYKATTGETVSKLNDFEFTILTGLGFRKAKKIE